MEREIRQALNTLAAEHRDVKRLIQKYDLSTFKPQLKREPYESLVRSIAHQQLHGKAAETILKRLIATSSGKSFPSPTDLLKLRLSQYKKCGFSKNKIKAIRDIARRAVNHQIPSRREIKKMTDHDIIERLIPIYGVGTWTVEMLLIFQLGRINVWPVDDFGVRRGYEVWKKKSVTAKELKKIGEKWRPYRTVMALLLWRVADEAKAS